MINEKLVKIHEKMQCVLNESLNSKDKVAKLEDIVPLLFSACAVSTV